MKFNKDVLDFLKGTKFSNGLKVIISSPENNIPFRMNYIEKLVKGKNIIHLGCLDHNITLIEQKIKQNIWFHKKLDECSNKCLGIDINRDGIEYIKKELGYKNVICHDILEEKVNKEIQNDNWDYIILGEMLEHIDNPVKFLKMIGEKYADHIDKLIISVPNAMSFENFKHAFKHIEFINSDHRYWFTPYTLGKVVTQAGLYIDSFQFCMAHKLPKKNKRFKKYLFNKYPVFRDTIVMIVKI